MTSYMMKRSGVLIACLLTIQAKAQEKLVIMGKAPNQYVVHTIPAETSLQNISNQFGQSVTRLSTYNDLNATAVLPKGKQIRIPLTKYNLIHTRGDENSAPVYHRVEKGETLFHIAKENGIAAASLRQWNGLKSDAVKPGQTLIVGYMVNARLGESKTAEPKKEEKTNTNTETVAVIATETNTVIPKEEPVKKQPDNIAPKPTKPATGKDSKTTTAVVTQTTKASAASVDYTPAEGDEGYFAVAFAQHTKEQEQQYHSGDAATFKSISGWTDHKYYVLINNVAPETIVRITAPNSKSICAKVLGPLQETKGGSGLLLRMSNSAASSLGITDPKFTVTITYYE
jgi:LysM repeat protein